MKTLDELRKALEDSDDLVEAIRNDGVLIITKREGERLILIKHNALAEALEMIREMNAYLTEIHATVTDGLREITHVARMAERGHNLTHGSEHEPSD